MAMVKRRQLTLSLVIPAYNEEHHLKACLDAISRQSSLPDEVIVVNNNSTDQTVAIAKLYRFVRIVNEPVQGVVFARNRGFNDAKSDVIGRIDADTILPNDWVRQCRAFYADDSHQHVAWAGGCKFYNMRFARALSYCHGWFVFRLNRLLLGHHVLWGSNMALPRRAWLEVRDKVLNQPNIHEDIDLSIHLHQSGWHIAHRRIKVGAKLRRVLSDRTQLYTNLLCWPRTLRLNGSKLWVLSWLLGTLPLYCLSGLPLLVEHVVARFGKTTYLE